MSITSIFAAAAIGALSTIISRIIADKIFPGENRKAIKNIALSVLFVVITLVSNYFVMGEIRKYEAKETLIKEINEAKTADLKVFKIIEKYDPEEYAIIIDKMIELSLQHKNKTQKEFSGIMANYGAVIFKKYLKRVSPEILLEYVKATVLLIETLGNLNVDLTCAFLFPGVYGIPHNMKAVSEVMENIGYLEIFEKVISYSVKNTSGKVELEASYILLEAYRETYMTKYPDHFKYMTSPQLAVTKKEKKILIDSLIYFYKDILKQKKKYSVPTLRTIF